MVSEDRRRELVERVRRLRRLRQVPDDVLAGVLWEHGCCVGRFRNGLQVPPFAELAEGSDDPDRALAEYLCTGCPVVDHCLELELRTCGAQTVGVFGGLTEDERREVHRLWLADRATASEEPRGGPSS